MVDTTYAKSSHLSLQVLKTAMIGVEIVYQKSMLYECFSSFVTPPQLFAARIHSAPSPGYVPGGS